MKTKGLIMMLALLLIPLGAMAQYWESGTQKTNNFYDYYSGGNNYSKKSVWYNIYSEQDGKMEFSTTALGSVRITAIDLYAVVNDENVWVAGGTSSLITEDIAAGEYRVRIIGYPTDKEGMGGNFITSYVLYPADYVNDPEPNDTWELAYQIESGNMQKGHLGYRRGSFRDTEDWFKIVVPDEGMVTFTTNTSTSLQLGYLGMYTLNEKGTDVTYRNDKWMSGEGKDTTVVYTIPDVAPGTYYVRLRRYDGYGSYNMKYTFTSNAYGADVAGNDTWEKAVSLTLDKPTEGRLGFHFNGDTDYEDWYKIDVKEEGKLTFLTKTETTLRLGYLGMYTPNDETTEVNFRNDKWMDAEGKDTTMVYEVPDVSIGTYYVRVRRYAGYGGYQLACYFTTHADEADPEPNNTWQESMLLKSGPAITGQLGYKYDNNTDTEDWYKIDIPKEGAIVFSTKTETTLRLGYLGVYTLNEKGTDVSYRNDKSMDGYGKDTTVVFTIPDVAPGTYYVRVRRYDGYGTYSLHYVFNPNTHENDPEPNNSWDKSSVIESGTTQQGCLGYHNNDNTDTEDWFKIVLPDEGKVTFATTSETTLQLGYLGMYTLDENGKDIGFRNDKWMSGEGKDTTVTYVVPDCAAGTYYVRVRRYAGYGGYNLDYTFTPNTHGQDNVDNDTWNKATVIENNTTQPGRLGYFNRNNTDYEDWFKILVPEEGKVVFATTSETTLKLGYLGMYTLNEKGTDVSFRNDKFMSGEGKDTTVTYMIPDVAPGTYYVRVRRYDGYGGYKLDYTFTPDIYGADVATNDSIQGASVLETGSTQQGRLGFHFNGDTDTEDWYKMDLPYVGNVTFIVNSENTLNLGYLGLYIPNEEGTDVSFRSDKWIDAEGKDTTITYSLDGLGAGTYYVRMRRYAGYGGYSMKYNFERNPFDRDNLQNSDFANRVKLEEGQTISTTLGYSYRKQNSEDWYDLGLMHGRQIDVTVCPDTTHTLVIGVPALYIYKGDREDGSPILENVAEKRLERSQGTISYIDKNEEDCHYVFRVPNYTSSSCGGYTITFEGGNQSATDAPDLANYNINVMTEGRNTVRKGVPCENPITITNTSNQKTDEFLVAITASDNVDIIGFRLNSKHGPVYLPIDSVTVMDGGEREHTALFLVPSLDPWESYTFTMISEGKGDIAYSRDTREFFNGRNKIIITGTTFVVVSVLTYVADAYIGEKIQDYLVDFVAGFFELNEQEAKELAEQKGVTVAELGMQKKEDGIAVYTTKAVVKKWLERIIKLTPQGKVAVRAANILECLWDLTPAIRRRVELWMYRAEDYINDHLDIIDAIAAISDVVASWDPNEMVGPQGVGDEHYIGETQTINYRILFENKAEAGDAAYRVRVSDELDENVFDVSTVRFGETSHEGVGYNWEMKREGNKLTWDIKGIELPPNINAPEGEGYVSFSVDLKPNLPNGTKIKNMATIIFDKNFPIETNEFVNTIDLLPPTTTMASAIFNAKCDTINVKCNSQDAGAGVSNYLFFVSKNRGDYTYCGQSPTGMLTYPVDAYSADDEYHFYVLAIDNVGNTERIVPQAIEAVTGIKGIKVLNDANAQLKIFTIDGRYVGNSLQGLKKGVYLVGGKKLIWN